MMAKLNCPDECSGGISWKQKALTAEQFERLPTGSAQSFPHLARCQSCGVVYDPPGQIKGWLDSEEMGDGWHGAKGGLE
jgi:hypothetical protein